MTTSKDTNGSAPPTTTSTGRCYLLEIPPELRLQTYSFVYTKHITAYFNISHDDELHNPCFDTTLHCTSLPATCRTIYHEATPVLYGRVTFALQFTNWTARKKSSAWKSLGRLSACTWLPKIRRFKLRIFMASPSSVFRGCSPQVFIDMLDATLSRLDNTTDRHQA